MSEVGSAIAEVRVAIADASGEFMADLCDLIPPALVTQGDGHTLGDGTPITGIPCNHEEVSGGVTFHDGESVVTKSNRVTMGYTATTVAITRQYKIKVHANGANPELILEQPVIQRDSMSPLLDILAVKSEGYQQPGIT